MTAARHDALDLAARTYRRARRALASPRPSRVRIARPLRARIAAPSRARIASPAARSHRRVRRALA
ncbi:MAG TPA: hypothetical protein VGM88_23705 [Kofleriaceae bacterium]